jgi:hypothetical protein
MKLQPYKKWKKRKESGQVPSLDAHTMGTSQAAPSQIWRAATLRMPECKDFDGLGFGGYAIIEMVMNAGKVNAADTGKSGVPGLRPDPWL